jgi:hypothetical protein
MSIEDIYEMNTDWCVSCGTEHGYMCGPCEKCGGTIFTKKRPESEGGRKAENDGECN